ncbi:hypothetical protein KY332_03540 [Candidatus Woesearchaeota archaeon]|nr:hypothetical protein [Candidatus Woesearchaeota archaeon]
MENTTEKRTIITSNKDSIDKILSGNYLHSFKYSQNKNSPITVARRIQERDLEKRGIHRWEDKREVEVEDSGIYGPNGHKIIHVTDVDDSKYRAEDDGIFERIGDYLPEEVAKEEVQKESLVKKIAMFPLKHPNLSAAAGVALALIAGANQVHAEGTSKAREFQDADSEHFFSDYYDILGKITAIGSEDYNKFKTSFKVSRDPVGLYAFTSSGSQDISLGEMKFKESGIDFGLYHPFEFDGGKINTGVKVGARNRTFEDYPIGSIHLNTWNVHAKIMIGDDLKAFISYSHGNGDYEYGGEKDYSESSFTVGVKKFIDLGDVDLYFCIDFDNYRKEYEGLGSSSKNIISVPVGLVGENFDFKIGAYGGNETGFDDERETIDPGFVISYTRIINPFIGFTIRYTHDPEMGDIYQAGLTGHFKDK